MTSTAQTEPLPYCRAAHTADPLRLPGAPRGTTTPARRWRDLVRGYADLLGPERLARPDVRARLSALVSLQLLLEQTEARVARGEPTDHNVLVQGAQQLTKLLDELGLSAPPPASDDQDPLSSYLKATGRDGNGDGSASPSTSQALRPAVASPTAAGLTLNAEPAP